MARVILFNKPMGILSQFTDEKSPSKRPTLSGFGLPKGVYAAGRLDRDSEGLLILTDDGKLQARIANPKAKTKKTYLVQVEGTIDAAAIKKLCAGVPLKDGMSAPAQAQVLTEPEWLWSRVPPIRERKAIPTSWLQLTITEGRNRQVRRMTAATGYPTLRLIRTRVGPWQLNTGTQVLMPGEMRQQQLQKTDLHHT